MVKPILWVRLKEATEKNVYEVGKKIRTSVGRKYLTIVTTEDIELEVIK